MWYFCDSNSQLYLQIITKTLPLANKKINYAPRYFPAFFCYLVYSFRPNYIFYKLKPHILSSIESI
uniref:Uncharacterized protein n=1 Tax=Lepeophtheirus salmonis TaxID=72036 RepID=A0A0K2T8S9_LEPSM